MLKNKIGIIEVKKKSLDSYTKQISQVWDHCSPGRVAPRYKGDQHLELAWVQSIIY